MTTPTDIRNDGFTLVETIIVVVLIAIVASVVGAAITVFVRNEGSVSTRLTNSRDLQNLTNFLPADVASSRLVKSNVTGVTDDLVPAAATCGSVGEVVLHVEWAEGWTPAYSNKVTYRVLPNAANPDELIRFECENSGPASTFTIAKSFDTMSIELQRDTSSPPKLTGTVDLRLTYPDGEYKRVTATSRHFLPAP